MSIFFLVSASVYFAGINEDIKSNYYKSKIACKNWFWKTFIKKVACSFGIVCCQNAIFQFVQVKYAKIEKNVAVGVKFRWVR